MYIYMCVCVCGKRTLTKLFLGEVPEVGRVREDRVPQLGELGGHVLDDEDAERVGAEGLLERLEGDGAYLTFVSLLCPFYICICYVCVCVCVHMCMNTHVYICIYMYVIR